MELFSDVLLGFSVALTPTNLLYGFLGVLLGTVIGVLLIRPQGLFSFQSRKEAAA